MRTNIARMGTLGAGAVLALGLVAFAPPAGATGSGGHGVNHSDSTCFTATGHTQGRSHSDPDGMSNGGADKPGCTGGFDADKDGNNGCGNDADREDDNNGWCGRRPHKAEAGGEKAQTPAQAKAPDTGTKVEAARDQRDDDILAERHHGCHGDMAGATSTTSTTPTTVASTVAATSSGTCGCVLGTTTGTGTGAGDVTPAALTAAQTGSSPSGTEAAASTAGTGTMVVGVAATAPATTAGSGGTTGTEVAGANTTTPTAAPGTQVLGEQLSRPSALARTGAGVGALTLLGLALCGGGRLTVLARRLLRIG